MEFLETIIQTVQRSLNLLFQSTLFLMFPLFQKHLNTQVRANKLVNSVVYHPCPSILASRIHPYPYFFKLLKGFISLQHACWIFSDLYIPSRMRKLFQFMVFTLENALNLCIFTQAPVPHSRLQVKFFEILFSLGTKNEGVEETMICSIKIQSENMKMTWNIN